MNIRYIIHIHLPICVSVSLPDILTSTIRSSKHEDHELHPRPWRRKASSPLGSAVFAAPDGKSWWWTDEPADFNQEIFFLHSFQQINVLEKTIHPHLLFSSIASQDRHIDSTGWFRVDLGSQTLNIWRNLLKKWGGSRYIYIYMYNVFTFEPLSNSLSSLSSRKNGIAFGGAYHYPWFCKKRTWTGTEKEKEKKRKRKEKGKGKEKAKAKAKERKRTGKGKGEKEQEKDGKGKGKERKREENRKRKGKGLFVVWDYFLNKWVSLRYR